MENWKTQRNEITQNFKQEFGQLNQDELNWKPNPKVWSIAQIIDHLIVINASYFPIIQSLRESEYKTPLLAKFGFISRLMGNAILKSVQPQTKHKTATFPIWEPTQSELPGDILKQFELHQKELKKVILESQDLIDKGTVISSPANRNIVYKLETAFEIMITHERRHFLQALNMKILMDR